MLNQHFYQTQILWKLRSDAAASAKEIPEVPAAYPSTAPSDSPTQESHKAPTSRPYVPTTDPSKVPTTYPTQKPQENPTSIPTDFPTFGINHQTQIFSDAEKSSLAIYSHLSPPLDFRSDAVAEATAKLDLNQLNLIPSTFCDQLPGLW